MHFWKKKQGTTAASVPTADLRKRVKILLVDDDENALPLDFLRSNGFTIEQWTSVRDLRRLEQGDFDIIILDIRGVTEPAVCADDGLGILRHLKEYNPAQVIIAFSGQNYAMDAHRFFRLADDVLMKPVDGVRCIELLDSVIGTAITVDHYWKGLKDVLKTGGLDERQCDRLEATIRRAISRKKRKDWRTILAQHLDDMELVARVAVVATKIAELTVLA